FAAPHTWWALGSPLGFPGGAANHRMWMDSPWRYAYDVLVILLSILGAFVALALSRPATHTHLRRIPRTLAWIAAALLSLRGLAGLIVDGTTDLVWWPTFLLGGVLFGGVALRSRRNALPPTRSLAV